MKVVLINLYGSDSVSPIQDWLDSNPSAILNSVQINGNFVYIFYS